MNTAIRKIHWCMGHRVLGHEGKCANLHGHNYDAEIYATAIDLDKVGRVVDFSVLKSCSDPWIQEEWDHSFMVNAKDQVLVNELPSLMENKKLVVVPFNPTAENIAQEILTRTNAELTLNGFNVKVFKVVVHETKNCSAVFEEPI